MKMGKISNFINGFWGNRHLPTLAYRENCTATEYQFVSKAVIGFSVP